MLLKVTPGKDWRRVRMLMRNYEKRLQYVQGQLCENVAEVFLQSLKSNVPDGKDYEEYVGSLRAVKLTGDTSGVTWAVVSDRQAVRIGELREREGQSYVVYIEAKAASDNPLVYLAAQNNPWPISMVPSGLPKGDVELVHRSVTRGELDFVKEVTAEFVRQNGHALKQLGSSMDAKKANKEEDSSDRLNSLPDYMWIGLRTEFGINVFANPHWKPAAKDIVQKIKSIIKGNKSIQRSLYDHIFRKYLETEKVPADNMSVSDFVKEAGKFSNEIAKSSGAKV